MKVSNNVFNNNCNNLGNNTINKGETPDKELN